MAFYEELSGTLKSSSQIITALVRICKTYLSEAFTPIPLPHREESLQLFFFS